MRKDLYKCNNIYKENNLFHYECTFDVLNVFKMNKEYDGRDRKKTTQNFKNMS